MSQYSKPTDTTTKFSSSSPSMTTSSLQTDTFQSQPSYVADVNNFESETWKRLQEAQSWVIPMLLAGITAAYTLLSSSSSTTTTSSSSPMTTTTTTLSLTITSELPTIHSTVGYTLIIIGYLLVPGMGVILMRRKRAMARTRLALSAETTEFDDTTSLSSPSSNLMQYFKLSNNSIERRIDSVTTISEYCCKNETENTVQEEEEKEQCAVCLSHIHQGETVRTLPCKHSFHKPCADLWLVTGAKTTCPLCMQSLFEDTHKENSCSR